MTRTETDWQTETEKKEGKKKVLKKNKKKHGSGGIRTHASEETGALNQRLRPLGHATVWRPELIFIFITIYCIFFPPRDCYSVTVSSFYIKMFTTKRTNFMALTVFWCPLLAKRFTRAGTGTINVREMTLIWLKLLHLQSYLPWFLRTPLSTTITTPECQNRLITEPASSS